MQRVGIIGAGQLGQMLGFAGRALDLEFLFLDPADEPPARVVGEVISASFDDEHALARLARECDVVTFEFENVPVTALESISAEVPIHPPADALAQAQDRLKEKELLQALDIPVAGWRAVSSRDELDAAIDALGLPLVLKTRRLGYDGKGQAVVRQETDVEPAWRRLGDRPLIAETWLPFDREVSVIGARSYSGETALWPLTENVHDGGILRTSRAPAVADASICQAAARYLEDLLARLEYVGVLALELFVVGNDLLANEIAPRVHNSGHWTIEGSQTSQFENHLRAILNLPLGATTCRGHAAMINLIGSMPRNRDPLLAAGFHLHDYGKTERPGRKLGHMTTIAPDAETCDARLSAAMRLLAQ